MKQSLVAKNTLWSAVEPTDINNLKLFFTITYLDLMNLISN
jgi:hypothetical protein